MLEIHIRESILHALRSLASSGSVNPLPEESFNFTVNEPKNTEHGDYSTNIAMVLAKPMQKQPRALAESLATELRKNSALYTRVEIAGPGFINLSLQDEAIQKVLPDVLRAGVSYGLHKSAHPKRILVEFVSANPTGPIHLGHARGTFIGDALVRLLRAIGNDVTSEFYINDTGNQVQTLGRSIYLRYRELFGEDISLGAGEYPGAYIIDIANTLKDRDGDKWLNAAESEAISYCTQFGIDENMKVIKATLEQAGVNFDSWYSERDLHAKNLPHRLLEDYRRLGMLYEAEEALGTSNKVRRDDSKSAHYAHQQLGGVFLRTSQFGDEEDRIVLRKNGTPVYLVADLAYHREKYERGFDVMIDVFGADHANHVQRLKAGMQAAGLNPHQLQFVTVQIVRMMRAGKEVRFSKRTGEVEELSDLLNEVGSDVARFVFLMRAANSQFDFDLDQALKKTSDNPVFYVQYGHARMATLLKRAADMGRPFADADELRVEILAHLALPEERTMIKKIASYPDVVLAAANNLEPHRILYYCQEMIAEFHSYFTKYRNTERIISDNRDLTIARLGLVAAMKQTLFNALSLLGISAPESMHHPDEGNHDDEVN